MNKMIRIIRRPFFILSGAAAAYAYAWFVYNISAWVVYEAPAAYLLYALSSIDDRDSKDVLMFYKPVVVAWLILSFVMLFTVKEYDVFSVRSLSKYVHHDLAEWFLRHGDKDMARAIGYDKEVDIDWVNIMKCLRNDVTGKGTFKWQVIE